MCVLSSLPNPRSHLTTLSTDNPSRPNQEMEDWKFVGMVLDRLFLWVFTVAVLGGTFGIVLRAPSLYDQREPIGEKMTTIGSQKMPRASTLLFPMNEFPMEEAF